ncbi:hypothetical protein LCGC14_1118430 [marine sediment metagenome]|uniref:Uncharacterized protein n=1 Tax=marine sediment metagenome TaxID=412755 RepID=A0A0F9M9I6_9ZZZZ
MVNHTYRRAIVLFALGLYIIVLLAVLSVGKTVRAIADPDTLVILQVTAYRGPINSTDILYLIVYNISYGSIPTEPTSDTFIGRISTVAGAELQSTTPIPFNDNGYGEGVFSFYFTEDEVENLGFAWEESLTITLQGNPSAFPLPPTIETSSITFRNQFTTEFSLQSDLILAASNLEVAWVANLVSLITAAGSNVFFDLAGEEYFQRTITNVNLMVPKLFQGARATPLFEELDRDFDQSYRDQLLTFWDGTYIGDQGDQFADTWGVERITLFTMIWLAMVGLIAAQAMKVLGRPDFAMLIFVVCIPIGAFVGMVDLVAAGLITFFFGLVTAYMFFYRGTA